VVAKQHVKPTLTDSLRELHLPAFREQFEEMARRAHQETLSYEQYLLELVTRECERRRAHRIDRMLQQSRLPLEKTLDNFDLKRLPANSDDGTLPHRHDAGATECDRTEESRRAPKRRLTNPVELP
jgi:DNA replication protein DnaC